MSAPAQATTQAPSTEADRVLVPAPTGELFAPPTAPDIAYPSPGDPAYAAYFQREGYVVARGLLPAELCDAARAAFLSEVKPYGGHIYRQATANPERHVMSPSGFMLNSILNIQSLSAQLFPSFRALGLVLLTHPNMQRAVTPLLGDDATVVQTMYFEGNPATWAHQDAYYLDATEPGRMVAAWVAVEDIAPGAGRFFVYPRSHLIDMAKNGGDFDIAFHHDRYKQLVLDVIRSHGLELRAPFLRKGDVLFWAAKTIHGSLATTTPERSRSSFTAHYIPRATRLLQYQKRARTMNLKPFADFQVHTPKDLNQPLPRAVFEVETRFPRAFQALKKVAVKALTR